MSMYSSGLAELFSVGVLGFILGYGFPRAEWLKEVQEKFINLMHKYFIRQMSDTTIKIITLSVILIISIVVYWDDLR